MTNQPGRRSADTGRRGGLTSTAVLALLLPALTVGMLLLVQAHPPVDSARPPEPTTLKSAAVACPSSPGGAGSAYVATGQPDVRGEVSVTSKGKESSVPLESGSTTPLSGSGAVIVEGEGELAPGLIGARFGDRRLAAVDCPQPSPEAWFTGVGAGTQHNSVLELTNPDAGPAVADITVFGRSGEVTASGLRGVTVSGNSSEQIDLSKAIPRRTELALHVVVSRGRLATTLLDEVPKLGARPLTQDWLAPQPEPARKSVLLGLPAGSGRRTLAVSNPGDNEARASVKILTDDAAFAPEGLDEIRVPPGTVQTLDLSGEVLKAIKEGALGLQVTSTEPVTAGVRSVVDGDLALAAPVVRSAEPMSLVVPPGDASVLLADAGEVGVVTVAAWNDAGKELKEQKLEVKPGTGGKVDLPADAALVKLTPKSTSVNAALLVTGGGATAVPFRELVTDALIPDVQPGQL